MDQMGNKAWKATACIGPLQCIDLAGSGISKIGARRNTQIGKCPFFDGMDSNIENEWDGHFFCGRKCFLAK